MNGPAYVAVFGAIFLPAILYFVQARITLARAEPICRQSSSVKVGNAKQVNVWLWCQRALGAFMRKIRYAIIGFGGIAENRIAKEGFGVDEARFAGHPQAELIGVADADPARQEAAALH